MIKTTILQIIFVFTIVASLLGCAHSNQQTDVVRDLKSENLFCKPNQDGAWFSSDEKLINTTRDIVIATVLDNKSTSKPSTIIYEKPQPVFLGNKSTDADLELHNIEWKFLVVETLKGDFEPGNELVIVSRRNLGNPHLIRNCDLPLGFSVGKTHLVFVNSYHPKGYQEVSSTTDAWLAEVRALVDSSNSK